MSAATYDDLISGMLPVGARIDLSSIPPLTLGRAFLVEPLDLGADSLPADESGEVAWLLEETGEKPERIAFEAGQEDPELPRGARVRTRIEGREVMVSSFPDRFLVVGAVYRAYAGDDPLVHEFGSEGRPIEVRTAPFLVPPSARRDDQRRDRRFLAAIGRLSVPGISRPEFTGTAVRPLDATIADAGIDREIVEELRRRGALRPARTRGKGGRDG